MYTFQVRCNREVVLPNKTTLGKNQTLSSKSSLKEAQSDLAWFEHDVINYLRRCSPQTTRGLQLELTISTNGQAVFSKIV